MKPYITPMRCVVVDVAAAITRLTHEDFCVLIDAWFGSIHETHGPYVIGASVDPLSKCAYVTFLDAEHAQEFQMMAQDQLWRAIAFLQKPRKPVVSNDEKFASWADDDEGTTGGGTGENG